MVDKRTGGASFMITAGCVQQQNWHAGAWPDSGIAFDWAQNNTKKGRRKLTK